MKNTYRACNWLILSDGYDPHYIESPKCWKDALLDHTEWSQGERNLELYQKAFDGFDDMNEAIQLFNTIFEYCEIRLMMPVEVGGHEVYIDVNGLR